MNAAEQPVFEETEKERNVINSFQPFAAEEKEVSQTLMSSPKTQQHGAKIPENQTSVSVWRRFKAEFGCENIFVHFPQTPALTKTHTLVTAYAYDYAVLYSVSGYFPPVCAIDPIRWFDEIIANNSQYPYNVLSRVAFQMPSGEWVMDYVLHDYVQNLIVKARAIATPFNGYTLQCVKPSGSSDWFNYFLENFQIRCG